MTEFKTVPITQFNIAYDAFIKSKEDNTPDTPVGRHLQAALNAVWQASHAHDGEVIYQYQVNHASGVCVWQDCSKSTFDVTHEDQRRATYTAPPRVVDEAMIERFCNSYFDDDGLGPISVSTKEAIKAALKAALEQSK